MRSFVKNLRRKWGEEAARTADIFKERRAGYPMDESGDRRETSLPGRCGAQLRRRMSATSSSTGKTYLPEDAQNGGEVRSVS